MWVIYGAIPMGMAFCVIRYIVEIHHSVKNFNKPEDRGGAGMTAALFITFAITAIMGFPIWIVLVLSCFAGTLGGSATPMLVIAQRMFTSVDPFPLLAIPLFMVAGNLMEGAASPGA